MHAWDSFVSQKGPFRPLECRFPLRPVLVRDAADTWQAASGRTGTVVDTQEKMRPLVRKLGAAAQ